MARDYAPRNRGNGKQQNKRKGTGELPGSVTLLVGLTIGLIIAAGVYIAVRPVHNGYHQQNKPALQKTAPATQQAAGGAAPKTQTQHFTFYDMLPNYEIVPYNGKLPDKRDAKTGEPEPEQPAQAIDTPGSYVIQAGSFADHDQADKRKAKMALLGVESHIQSGPGPAGQTRYRVRVGPVQDLNKVNTILKNLRQNNIETLLMRQKG